MKKFYSKKEYQKIADLFNIGKVHKIFKLHLGYGMSTKAAVQTSSGKFIVSKNILSDKKDIVSKSKESLQYEIDLLNVVKGLPVPVYRSSLCGNFIEKFGRDWVTVYDFIPGKSPRRITAQMALELGKFLGEFHKRGRKFKEDLKSRRRFYDLNPKVVKKMNPFARSQKNSVLKSVVERIKKGVEENRPSSKLPRGPIHVDIGHANELFQGNKLTGIIDFGNFYIDTLMIDVGKTVMWNCCPNKKINPQLLKEFIAGYNSRRKLNKDERAYLKKAVLFAIYSHIWVDLYHIPIKYVPESWPLMLIRRFLPVANQIEKSHII
ncbi:MAG: phosphotransferase [Candidatus Moranbacteria bacterium]|nr:phosphotransferase [Candidatus Moranbacteria bacterium]